MGRIDINGVDDDVLQDFRTAVTSVHGGRSIYKNKNRIPVMRLEMENAMRSWTDVLYTRSKILRLRKTTDSMIEEKEFFTAILVEHHASIQSPERMSRILGNWLVEVLGSKKIDSEHINGFRPALLGILQSAKHL